MADQQSKPNIVLLPETLENCILFDNLDEIQKSVMLQLQEHEFNRILNNLVQSQKSFSPNDISEIFIQGDTPKNIKSEDLQQWIRQIYCQNQIKEIEQKENQLKKLKIEIQKYEEDHKSLTFENTNLTKKYNEEIQKSQIAQNGLDELKKKLEALVKQLQNEKKMEIIDSYAKLLINKLKVQNFLSTQEIQKTEFNTLSSEQKNKQIILRNQTRKNQEINQSQLIQNFLGGKELTLIALSKALKTQKTNLYSQQTQIQTAQDEIQIQESLLEQLLSSDKEDEQISLEGRLSTSVHNLTDEISLLINLRTEFNQVNDQHMQMVQEREEFQRIIINLENEIQKLQQKKQILRPPPKSILSQKHLQIFGLLLIFIIINHLFL